MVVISLILCGGGEYENDIKSPSPWKKCNIIFVKFSMLFILVAPAELSDENQDVEEDDKINIDKIKKILEATNEK